MPEKEERLPLEGEQLRLYLQWRMEYQGWVLVIGNVSREGTQFYRLVPDGELVEPGGWHAPGPAAVLQQHHVQDLLDQLVHQGVRPTTPMGADGEQKRHLEDMRRIALAGLTKAGLKLELE